LLNLLGNAVKYTDNGWINCEARFDVQDAMLRFVVSDNGAGIPEAHLDNIFLPFFQGNGSNARRSGVGLGLAITKTQVTSMGGKICAQNRVGGGSIFEVLIPAIFLEKDVSSCVKGDGEVCMSQKKQEILKSDACCRVLVIDDNALNRVVLKRLVSKMVVDSEVIEVENGFLALDLLNGRTQFHIIFCDWLMPVLSGEEVALLLRKREAANRWCRTPIVCVSAAVSLISRSAMLQSGMDAILQKPISMDGLLQCMKDILGGSVKLMEEN
jgi:CheY-like chemotaxis protein